MLKTACINPDIMSALTNCGHGDKVLIADGNYPLFTKSGNAKKVFLGLTEGVPTVTQVLEVINQCVNIEKAELMQSDGQTPAIFKEFTQILGNIPMEEIERHAYYEACQAENLVLAISTGEKRVFANILLTIGVA